MTVPSAKWTAVAASCLVAAHASLAAKVPIRITSRTPWETTSAMKEYGSPDVYEPVYADVLNGLDAEKAPPFIVSMAITSPEQFENGDRKRRHGCGGSLIAPDWVLTARHCIHPIWDEATGKLKELGHRFDGWSMTAYIGGRDKSEFWDFEIINIASIVCPPESPNSNPDLMIDPDLCLFKLETPSSATDFARLARGDEGYEADGLQANLYGWGMTVPTDYSSAANILQETGKIVIESNTQCSALWSYLIPGPPVVTPAHICFAAGDTNGASRGACHGDSGGPWLSVDKSVQIGVVSFGVEGCGDPTVPSVGVRVSSHIKWVQSVVKDPLPPTRRCISVTDIDGSGITPITSKWCESNGCPAPACQWKPHNYVPTQTCRSKIAHISDLWCRQLGCLDAFKSFCEVVNM